MQFCCSEGAKRSLSDLAGLFVAFVIMPHHCCVPMCSKNSKRNPNVSFHKFPLPEKDRELHKRWLDEIRRDEGKDFTVNKHTKVCSEHFKAEDFTPGHRASKDGRRSNPQLKPGVVPSVFLDFPTRLQKSRPKRKKPMDRSSLEPTAKRKKKVPEPEVAPDLSETAVPEVAESDVCKNHCPCVAVLQGEVSTLSRKLETTWSPFSIDMLKNNDDKINYYTGFKTYPMFQGCFEFLKSSASNMSYWRGDETRQGTSSRHLKRGPRMKMTLVNQFLLVMMRLRLGLDVEDLADRFQVSQSTVSRIFTTWINLMYVKFQDLPMWPSRRKVNKYMPPSFQKWYPSTRIIIDGTEFFIEKPSSLARQSATWSSYKNHNTFKSLIGISPDGAITFVSDLYEGSISDRELTEVSGLLQKLERGDSVMADKGFEVQDMLASIGVRLNIPPKKRGDRQMTPEDICKTKKIAAVRIHVERAIRRIKLFRLLAHTIPNSLASMADQLVFVAAALCNFQPGLAA